MENICRTCLAKDVCLEPVSTNNLIFKIKILSSVEVVESDNLPSKICQSCLLNINGYYEFREKIITSDKVLRETIIKKEEHQDESNKELKYDVISRREARAAQEKNLHVIKKEIIIPTFHSDNESDFENEDNGDMEWENDINNSDSDSDSDHIPDPMVENISRSDTFHFRKDETGLMFECLLCNFKNKNRRTMWNHKFHHLPKVKCPICEKEFRENCLKRHLKSHENKKESRTKVKEEMDSENTTSDSFLFESKASDDSFEPNEDDDDSDYVEDEPKRVTRSGNQASKTYSCEKCDFVTKIRSTFATHRNTHFPKTPCELCGQLIRKGGMKQHVLIHEKKPGFEEKLGYNTSFDETNNVTTFSCIKCDFTTTDRKHLMLHRRTHGGKVQCEICNKIILKSDLSKHLETHTDVSKSTLSPSERKQLDAEKKKMKRMVMVTEKDEEGSTIYRCLKCDFKTFTEKEAKQHKTTHVRRTICNFCGASVTAYNFRHHLNTHIGKSITCEICGRVFKNASSYQSHPPMHIEEENTCDKCGKHFTIKGEYIRHLRLHREKEKRFKCSLCEKAFADKKTYEKHLRSHTGERPFPCEYCGKKLSSGWALKTHIRQHTNECPYACDLCPMAFPQRVSLKTHMKSKHNIDVRKGESKPPEIKEDIQAEIPLQW